MASRDQPAWPLKGQDDAAELSLQPLLAAPQSSLETAPGATGIIFSELEPQASLETAPGAAASEQLEPQASLETAPGAAASEQLEPQESAETAPGAAAVEQQVPVSVQHSPETAPGAAASCLLLLQPTSVVARARVAMVKKLFIDWTPEN